MGDRASTRTLSSKGQVIRELRIAKDWGVADLARNAGCSVKTIQNIENNRPAYLYTLIKVSTALGVETRRLHEGRVQDRTKKLNYDKTTRAEARLITRTPIEEFDETDQLHEIIYLFSNCVNFAGRAVPLNSVSSTDGVATIAINVDIELLNILKDVI